MHCILRVSCLCISVCLCRTVTATLGLSGVLPPSWSLGEFTEEIAGEGKWLPCRHQPRRQGHFQAVQHLQGRRPIGHRAHPNELPLREGVLSSEKISV